MKDTSIPMLPQTAPSWKRVEVSMDVGLVSWGTKQGQHEIFTLLRGHKWVGNAIGYASFIGAASPATVMVANLDLPGAAASDGRRVVKSFKYQEGQTYHVEYFYDAAANDRGVTVSQQGAVVTTFSAPPVTPPPPATPKNVIDVPAEGFALLLGGELSSAPNTPDAGTPGWTFSNVSVKGCPAP